MLCTNDILFLFMCWFVLKLVLLLCCFTVLSNCSSSDDALLDALFSWFEAGGGVFDGRLRVRSTSSKGRAVFAEEAVSEGTLLVRVPKNLLIHDLYSKDSAFGPVATSLYDVLSATEESALHLLFLKHAGVETRFLPYINSLPKTFSTPLFWTDEELDLLEASHVRRMVYDRKAVAEKRYGEIFQKRLFKTHPGMFRHSDITLSEFEWALSVLWSRAFALVVDKFEVRGLVPVADLFNSPSATNETSQIKGKKKPYHVGCA